MRRAVAAFVATVAGLLMLLNFKSAPASPGGALPIPGTSSDPSAGAPGGVPSSSGAPPSSDPPSSAATQGPTPSPAPQAASTPAAKSTPKSTPTPTPKAATSKTATGSSVPVSEGRRTFGYVQVKVTVSGGKITNLVAVNYPRNDPRSYEISSYSIPILQQEVLAAQGTRINVVSGATYTSDAYAQSVQAALDAMKS